MPTKRKTKSGITPKAPPERAAPDWDAVATDLRADPMEWYQVFERGKTTWKEAARQGHVAAVHPRLGFEYRTTDNRLGPPRTCTLFMRYNPDKADEIAVHVHNNKEK